MSQPIKIIVSAETMQAAAVLHNFATQGAREIQILSQTGVSGFLGVGKSAEEAGLKIAGMSYYARGAIDSIRYAAAGGGARAGFYALDETIRGLLQSGIRLGTLVPIIGGIAAAVGAGYYVWEQWNAGEREAAERAKDLADAFKALPPLLKEIAELQKGGLLSGAAATEYQDYLTGKKKLYVDNKGQVTRSTESTTEAFTRAIQTPSGPQFETIPAGTASNRLATQAEIQKWVKDQATAGGTLTDVQIEAQAKLKEELHAMSEEHLTGVDKEIAKVHDQQQKQRDEMTQTALLAGTKLGDINFANTPQVRAVNAALAQNKADEADTVAGLRQKARDEAAKKQVESANRIHEQGLKDFESINQEIETQITLEAQKAGRQREDLWQEEYKQRITAATSALYSGQIDEKTYDKSVAAAQKNMFDGQKRYNEELLRTRQMELEIERGAVTGQLQAIRANPDLSNEEKARQSIPLQQQLIGINQSYLGGLNQELSQSTDTAQLEIRKQINQTIAEQLKLEQELKAAQGAGSWQSAYIFNLVKLQNQWGDLGTSVTNGAFRIMQQGISGVANALTGLIMGTRNAGQAFAQLGASLLSNFISTILEAVIYAEIAVPILTELGVLSGGATAEMGATATVSALALARSAAMAGMYDKGGYTGDISPNKVAGIVHGKEYVISAPAVQRIGVDNLEHLHRYGYMAGGLVGGGSTAGSQQPGAFMPKVVNVFTTQQMLEELKKSDYSHVIVQHVINNKTRIGIPT